MDCEQFVLGHINRPNYFSGTLLCILDVVGYFILASADI